MTAAPGGGEADQAWTPAFPGQRPPFVPGHTASMVHGARSERRVGPLAGQIAGELLADADTPDHLREPVFSAAVQGWARAEAICVLLREFLDGQDIEAALTETTKGTEEEEREGSTARRTSVTRRVTAALDASRRWEAHAANLRSKLGLDPVSAARVGRDLATSRYLQRASPLDAALDQIEERRRQALEPGGAGSG